MCIRDRVKGYKRLGHIRNEYIIREPDIVSINELIENNRNSWKQHLERMDNTRFPKLAYEYEPVGWRSVGRQVTRLQESWGRNRKDPIHEVMMMMVINPNFRRFPHTPFLLFLVESSSFYIRRATTNFQWTIFVVVYLVFCPKAGIQMVKALQAILSLSLIHI